MESRRGFLRKGLAGGALLALGGASSLAFRRTLRAAQPRADLLVLSPDEYAVFAAIAERVVAVSGDAPSTESVDVAGRADAAMFPWPDDVQVEFRRLLRLFENALTGAAMGIGFETFTASEPRRQDERLAAWQRSRIEVFRSGFEALRRLAAACYYGAPATWPSTGYPGPPELGFTEAE